MKHTGFSQIMKMRTAENVITVRVSSEMKSYLALIASHCEISVSELVRDTLGRLIQNVREETSYAYDEEALL